MKKGAAITITLLITIMISLPSFSASFQPVVEKTNMELTEKNVQTITFDDEIQFPAIRYDTNYYPEETVAFAGEQNDVGYNTDTGDSIRRANQVYISEPVDENIPGRGRTGTLDPPNRDKDDYYRFTVCKGQQITSSISSSHSYAIEILDEEGELVAQGDEAATSGWHFIHIYGEDDDPAGDYLFDVTLIGQNDADTGSDAGDSLSAATMILPGEYTGFLSSEDVEDWYCFDVSSGQGIEVFIKPLSKSDYDIHLYNPEGALVHSAQYYGEDTLEYPADETGTWSVKIDIFPGWDESKWPDDYYLYGSGSYELKLSFIDDASEPIIPKSQPDIVPVAKTFVVENDDQSNNDEYAYLAAVPAANYLENGQRHLSPIVYQGIDKVSTWFTTVDETTQYLIDDWNTFLNRHDMSADVQQLSSDPVTAAANIATTNWDSSNTVVVTVNGGEFSDTIETVADKDTSLSSTPIIEKVSASDLQDFGGTAAKPMFLGNKWGALHLVSEGPDFAGDTGIVTPRYEGVMEDWWPYPYDANGKDYDTFYPVTKTGLWFPYVTETTGLNNLNIIKYPGDRYSIPVTDTDTSIEVEITTEQESNLIVYLIDPEGNVRRPHIPHYNGGEIKPIHQWNGGHWEQDQDEFRRMIFEPHTEYSVEVHNAMTGTWTAIVVPYLSEEGEDVGFTGSYHITAQKRLYSPERTNAAMSAANAAVIASMNHAPLLYVTESEVPSATQNALDSLNPSNIIFVNLNEVSSASVGASETLTSMQEIIDAIKSNDQSENFITITSLGTGDGYFAPSTMAAAYHTAPVLNIGEAPEAFNAIDQIASWREYAGDYYHGCLSVGHLPQIGEPIDLKNPPSWFGLIWYYLMNDEFPPLGLDLKLQWFSTVSGSIQNLVDGYSLDLPGKEAFLFVSPRDTDIRDVACRAVVGNESFGGHIPVETTGFSSAVICRDILYPALIYANPGRDVVTSQMMNYPDGYRWQANDGNGYYNYATRSMKETFMSRDRFFEGHCIYDNLLERYNKGAVFSYYSGHGTGGSGISAQYKNVAEQFPLAEVTYEHLYDFDWWDSWRGYSGYDNRQTKTSRWGGSSGYNSQEPNLYDFIHFKWMDESLDNLHSEIEIWSSCTTGEHWGPIMYLSHGSALWYGAAGSTYGVQDDLHNEWIFHDVLVEGDSFGNSESKYQWLFNRDFTTLDPTTLYGTSTLFQLSMGGLTNVKVLFGDPTMTCYAPDWIEPSPIEG